MKKAREADEKSAEKLIERLEESDIVLLYYEIFHPCFLQFFF